MGCSTIECYHWRCYRQFKSDNAFYADSSRVSVEKSSNTLLNVKHSAPEPTKPYTQSVAPEPTSDSYTKNNIIFSVCASGGGILIAVIVVVIILYMKKRSAPKNTVVPNTEPLLTRLHRMIFSYSIHSSSS